MTRLSIWLFSTRQHCKLNIIFKTKPMQVEIHIANSIFQSLPPPGVGNWVRYLTYSWRRDRLATRKQQ